LTALLAQKTWALIGDIEVMGGMTQAVERGLPKRLIEEVATRRQAAIDKGEDVIVGVNKQESQLDRVEIDNAAVCQKQIARLERVRRERDPQRGAVTLSTLEATALR
jgi:methylmalonyl-CoA mutase